jgi:hypothetical protein
MPKVKKANTKTVRKADEKAQNIQLAVKAYKDPTSGLSLRAAVSLYHCSKDSITNHLDDTPQVEYAPDVYVEQQKLSPAEETALVNHIIECYQLMLPLDVELLHYYANELCRAKGDHTPVGKNWYHKFYERNPSVKTLRAGSAFIPEASIPYRYRIVLVSIARIDTVSI